MKALRRGQLSQRWAFPCIGGRIVDFAIPLSRASEIGVVATDDEHSAIGQQGCGMGCTCLVHGGPRSEGSRGWIEDLRDCQAGCRTRRIASHYEDTSVVHVVVVHVREVGL